MQSTGSTQLPQSPNTTLHRNCKPVFKTVKSIFVDRKVYKYQDCKTILNCIWEHKKFREAKAILNNKRNAGDVALSDFKMYHKAAVVNPA